MEVFKLSLGDRQDNLSIINYASMYLYQTQSVILKISILA